MLDEAFVLYQDIYRNILDNMYPSKGATGFQERNMAVNFSKAYEAVAWKKGHKACSWFEFQFGEKNNLHMDAVMLDPWAQELVLVEAKRYSNPLSKMQGVRKDIDRVYELVSELNEENRIDMNAVRHIYGVILADVWDETRTKRRIIEAYRNGKILEEYSSSMANEYRSEGAESHAQCVDEDLKYYLVSLVWEI